MHPNHDHTLSWAVALKIATVYAIAGSLWILCSGWLLHHFVHDEFRVAELEAVKGWFYVLVTAVLLGCWLDRYFREIRRTTELLRKSEVRFATIFKNSPMAVAISRLRDSVFVDANEAFVQLYGYPREEIIGRTWEQLQLWHSGNRAQVIAELREKEHVVAEMQSCRKNGEVRDLLASLQRIELDGEPCIAGTLVDVTERKKAEAALREGEERLRFALESCHIGAWDLDLAGHTAFRSLEHARIFGYEKLLADWTREMFLEHVLPEDRALVNEKIQRTIETQSDFSFECRIRRVDGQVRWIWVAGRYRVDAGDKARHLAGIVQDITERKAHEAEIERLSRLYATLSQINQTIVRVNSHGELAREVARVAVEFGGFKMAWVGRHNPQTREVAPLGWAGEQWEIVRNFRHSLADTTEHRCLCAPVIRENRSCVFNDLSASLEMHDWLSVVGQAGIRAAAVFPIRVRDAVWGVFGIYEGEPNVFKDKETALLEEAAMDIGYAIERIENEAQRRQAEKFQLLSTAILGVLNEPLTLQEASNTVLGLIKKETGLDAVGIRLKDGDDFPYFSTEGLDKEFLLAENSVILRSDTGAACRDANGQICLQCTCGMVLAEKCGPPGDGVTAAGSIWTNDSRSLVESLNGHDPRLKPRNRCIHEGFLSVALIPIRADQQMIGLLHLNDRRKDRFTPETVRFFEGLTASFGIAVKRRRAEDALRESEARFRSLIEGAPEAIFVQCGGTFKYVNRAMMKLVGATRAEDLLERPFLERIAPAYHNAIRERIRTQRETKAVAPPMEQEYLRLDGMQIPVETTAVAFRFQGQDGHLVFVHDITARRESETERSGLKAQLQQAQKMESIGRLAGGVAHDFNNLLMGIMGYAELAREEVAADHPVQSWLDEITAGVQRSAGITRQLLAFARKQTILPVVLDINDHVAGTLKLLRRLIGEDIELTWRPGAREARVKMDPSQIDQILANLAVNARDAIIGVGNLTIETGQALIDAEYCAEHAGAVPGTYVVLAVSDSGCGMDRATMEYIFEPFFTTKGPGKGTGLGLATVYGILQQNRGFVNVYSEPGKGTTFRVYIPQLAEEEADRDSAATTAEVPGGSETVLLVEDEKSVRVTTGLFLQGLGYRVLTAADPKEALHQAEGFPGAIHLLITDVVMPGMSGRDLAAKLSATHLETACLYISGYTADFIAHQGVLEEGVHFLAKPFTREDLAHKVRETLRDQREAQDKH